MALRSLRPHRQTKVGKLPAGARHLQPAQPQAEPWMLSSERARPGLLCLIREPTPAPHGT